MGLFSPDKTRPRKAVVDVDDTGTIKTITLTEGTFRYQTHQFLQLQMILEAPYITPDAC